MIASALVSTAALMKSVAGVQRAQRDHLVAGLLQRHRQDPVADDVRVGADDAGDHVSF
jgi:hypothetical protein